MKKLFFAAYTFTLAALAPAVFIGYLYSNNQPVVVENENKIEKTTSTTGEFVATYPASMIVAVR